MSASATGEGYYEAEIFLVQAIADLVVVYGSVKMIHRVAIVHACL